MRSGTPAGDGPPGADGDPAAVLPPPLLRAVERILSDAGGAPARIVSASRLAGRDHVVRVVGASGAQAVVKRARADEPGWWGRAADEFASEWAALELLASVPGSPAVTLIGGDAEAGVLVVEHLDVERTVADSLLGADGDRARADVVAYGALLGTVHGATIGRVDELVALRRRHGVADAGETRWSAPLRLGRDAFLQGLVALRIAAPGGPGALERELDRVGAVIAGGGRRGLVHGDPCPDNVVVAGGRLRLLDFERATPGHVALDAGYLVAPFPSCWCFARLPADVVAAARAAHRGALEAAGVDPGDDWDEAIAAALATWLVVRGPNLVEALGDDPPEPWGTTTMRPRLVAWADACAGAPGAAAFPAVRAAAADLAERLRSAWPEVVIPGYPGLVGPGEPAVSAPDDWEPTVPP